MPMKSTSIMVSWLAGQWLTVDVGASGVLLRMKKQDRTQINIFSKLIEASNLSESKKMDLKHAIDEELVRLHSHIGQFVQSVRSEGPVGRNWILLFRK